MLTRFPLSCWGLLCLCVLFAAGDARGVWAAQAEGDAAADVAAEAEPEAGDHGDADHGAAHDPYEDALHGNAGPQQEDFTEIKASLALWTLVVFGLLLLILWKFAWGPLSEALDRREAGIAANIEAAKQQNEDAAKLLAEHEARMAGAADDVRKILDDARRDAETQKQQILSEAQSLAESEKHRALREIDAAKNGALQELAERSVDVAMGMAGKIVQRNLSTDDHAALISEALEHFPSKS